MKNYIIELDGVRAIAVISVMVFHIGIFPIGWMGVPLFFVLSGYLITSILMDSKSLKFKDYIVRFFWRRTLRIFPLYYGYLLVNFLLSVFVGISVTGYAYFVFYLGNYRIGDLAPNVPGGVVGHLWSVAVEEQFYLLWPWLIYYTRKPVILAVGAILFAPLFREILFYYSENPYITIVSLPSCVDMLGAGALVALSTNRKMLLGMALLGGTIITYCFSIVPLEDFAYTDRWVPQAHIIYTGLGLFTAPLVAYAKHLRFLGTPPLRFVGRISYGLYMWHLIVFAAVHRMNFPFLIEVFASFVGTFFVAAISWKYFESYFLKFKDLRRLSGLST